MKKKLMCLAFLSLVSCSSNKAPSPVTQEYSIERNCSPRALEKLAAGSGDARPVAADKTHMEIREQIRKLAPGAQECFQNALDTKNADDSPYQVCLVIGTSKEGYLDFIDVEDNTHPLSAPLKNCIIENFIKVNIRKAKNATITQPIRLQPRRVK